MHIIYPAISLSTHTVSYTPQVMPVTPGSLWLGIPFSSPVLSATVLRHPELKVPTNIRLVWCVVSLPRETSSAV